MITARGLTKRYGDTTAVAAVDFAVRPGSVTGFLGPNGAGKSTTMRMILGLDRPTAGTVTVNGRAYQDHPAPLHEVGALLEAKAIHGGRTAYNHLLWLAKSNGIPRRRVDEVIGMVGLDNVARKRSGGFSLGMGQRLGIAAALLGDPGVLLFDEPVNGLDPEGIRWIRTLIRSLAAEGRTVFVSSHLMSEMALTADHLLVIGRGQILADTDMNDFIARNSSAYVHVRSPHGTQLAHQLATRGWRVEPAEDGALAVYGTSAEQVGDVAGSNGLHVHELRSVHASLEEAFMRLTADSVDYHAGVPELPDVAITTDFHANRTPAGV
ncbi:ABC transporter ATP-binding protein [Phytoactinopolyspora alkaliphila]|uniref:ABC transporter ATP-binding protein n=1 Tax=Phytoactinopolyspora alkaliphila TaxID=1783498 RepID=A0A6N9YJ09_9ACTN|nr:ABC transporter ATP-binding protein [Phytoactinopolyspora alkaliphila]NED94937.1 ABC transporter ATP-binding protein [Phytoactinopolyspora alkaliphila]